MNNSENLAASNTGYIKLTDLAQLTSNPYANQTVTYVVDSIINTITGISSNPSIAVDALTGVLRVKIAKNICIVFDGGQIDVPATYPALSLEGNDTAIKASPVQIFEENVIAEGTWDIEQAYPQWFDEMVGEDPLDCTDFHDCSSAISNAARMKLAGEVFLPEGFYFISNPIKLPIGITLIGEGCSHIKSDENDTFDLRGTVIIPFLKRTKDWPGKAFVEINIADRLNETGEDWESSYPKSFGMLSDICFYNKRNRPSYFPILPGVERETLSQIPCCYVAGSFTFQNLAFEGFRMCIKWSSSCYSDQKCVRNCSFFNDGKLITEPMDSEKQLYAIDAGYLGDAMIIERCHVQGYLITKTQDGIENRVKLFNALQASSCMGGSIANNIFNSDVHLFGCLATVYESNFMGDGAQLMLSGCDIAVRNNYFDKIKEPSIVVSVGALHKIQGDYEQSRDSNLEITGNSFMVRTDNKMDDGTKARRYSAADLCEFDIALSKNSYAPYTIYLSQNYRYANYDSRSNQPTGIMFGQFFRKIGTKEISYTPFDEFNNRSYYLSTKSQIMPNLKIRAACAFDKVPTLATPDNMGTTIDVFPTKAILNGRTKGPNAHPKYDWRYKYMAQLVMDVQRNIQSGIYGVNLKFADGGLQSFLPKMYGQVFDVSYTPASSCCILRLYRYVEYLQNSHIMGSSIDAFVEIPVIGTKYLYDDNESVNGYKWQLLDPDTFVEPTEGTKGSMLEFLDDNATYFLKDNTLPDASKWENHDEIIMPGGKIYFRIGDEWVKVI